MSDMQERPVDLAESALADALRTHWGLPSPTLRYAPVGFGDYHWEVVDAAGRDWFVTVADLDPEGAGPAHADGAFAALRAAMEAARALERGAGLDFVVGPAPARGGEAVRRLDGRYAVAVYPHVEGVPGHFYDATTPVHRSAVLGLLARLHGATPQVAGVPVHDPELPGRPALEAALEELDRPWTGGPYAEPAREELSRRGARLVRRALEWFDTLVARVHGDGAELVVTHGEPHPGNVLRVGERRLLIDWDTVGLAPRERDLWLVRADPTELAQYAEATGHRISEDALALYRLRWELNDLAEFLALFRAPHERNADTDTAWEGFTGALGRVLAELPGASDVPPDAAHAPDAPDAAGPGA